MTEISESLSNLPKLCDLNDDQFIVFIYFWILGRAPDSQGKSHYLKKLKKNTPRKVLIAELAAADELSNNIIKPYQDRLDSLVKIYKIVRKIPIGFARWWFLPGIDDLKVLSEEKKYITSFNMDEYYSSDNASLSIFDRILLDGFFDFTPSLLLLTNCFASFYLNAQVDAGVNIEHILYTSRLSDDFSANRSGYHAVVVGFSLRDIVGQACYGLFGYHDGDLIFQRDINFEELLNRSIGIVDALIENLQSFSIPIFLLGFIEPPKNIGDFSNRNQSSQFYLVTKLNDYISSLSERNENFFFVETNDIVRYFGAATNYDGYSMCFMHASFSAESVAPVYILKRIKKMLAAIDSGNSAIKVIISDLDGTLWKGVLAEEESIIPWMHTEGWPLGYAEALLTCKARGILLAICSKNDEEQTRIRFNQVWYGRLRLEDFASIRINWQPKSENIRQILAELNILPEHALFIDDNPLEIAEVQRAFPQMRTLTGDPHQWRMVLLYGIPFQVAKLSEESTRRTELLQAKIQRDQAMLSTDRESFLRDLQLRAEIHPLTPSDKGFDRALELLNRTNQFNTTGQRWTTAELQDFLAAEGRLWVLQASDRLARHGLVAVALLQADCLWQMVLSCRVFGLGLEEALLARILDEPAPGATLQARWMDTGRNATARQFLEQFFAPQTEDRYALRERLVVPAHITV